MALGVLPLTLLGIGHNTLQNRQSVLEILNNDQALKLAGLAENDRAGILKAAKDGDDAKAQSLLQEAWSRRDPAVAAEAIKETDEAQDAATQRLKEERESGSGHQPQTSPAPAAGLDEVGKVIDTQSQPAPQQNLTGPPLPFDPSPNLEWHVPHDPNRHLLPDQPFDASRKPMRPPKVLDKNDTNIHNKRGVDGENETAEVLAQNGYAYEQVAQNKERLPDGTWAGTADGVFGKAPNSKSDVYSPSAQTNLRNIYDTVVGKVERQKSPYVIVRIEPGGQGIEDISKKFHERSKATIRR